MCILIDVDHCFHENTGYQISGYVHILYTLENESKNHFIVALIKGGEMALVPFGCFYPANFDVIFFGLQKLAGLVLKCSYHKKTHICNNAIQIS